MRNMTPDMVGNVAPTLNTKSPKEYTAAGTEGEAGGGRGLTLLARNNIYSQELLVGGSPFCHYIMGKKFP